MTYSLIYCALISKRLQNPISKDECYCETHHIIPKSEGGPNTKDNLVNLTDREHYVAHLLLAKIYNDYKMWAALWRMSNTQYRFNSRLYALAKQQRAKSLSEHFKNRVFSEETKAKMSLNHADVSGENNPMYGIKLYGQDNPFYGKTHSIQTKNTISNKLKTYYTTHKNPMYGRKHSEESKIKNSLSNKGKHWYNNGIENKYCRECPDGFVPGKLKHKQHRRFFISNE